MAEPQPSLLSPLPQRRPRFFNPDPHQPLGAAPPPPPEPPPTASTGPTVDARGIWLRDGSLVPRNDPLLGRALLMAGVRWHQLMPLPRDAFTKPAVPGQLVPEAAVEKRIETYDALRFEGVAEVLRKYRHLQRDAERRAAREEQGDATSSEDIAELQRAGLVDPIAKAKAEAAAMMKIEVERQEKLMQSRAAKAARELDKVRATEALKLEKAQEQERIEALFKQKQRERAAEINRRRQEASLWRVQQARQKELDEEQALDAAHVLLLERAERDRKIKQRELEVRNARTKNVGNSQSCMVSKLRIICKQLAFVEALRDQHLSDRKDYFEELEEAICSFDDQDDADGMVKMADGACDDNRPCTTDICLHL